LFASGCNFGDDEEFDNLMRSIVNGQNAQIQYMRDYLDAADEPSVDEAQCESETARSRFSLESDAAFEAEPDSLLRGQECRLIPAAGAPYTTVTVTMDYYASEFGYYKFETADVVCRGSAPNLVLAADHEYRFVQKVGG
jgi:hypothetical protein